MNKPKYGLSSDSNENVPLAYSDGGIKLEFEATRCTECLEFYQKTKTEKDWIQCNKCSRWLHETCLIYSCVVLLWPNKNINKKREEKINNIKIKT